MTIEVTKRIQAEARPDEVWAVMSDVVRWPEWTDSVSSVRRLDSGVFGVGSRVAIKQPRFPEAIWSVTRIEPGVGFEWENSAPGMRSHGSHYVRPSTGGGSEITLSIKQEGPFASLFGWWLKGIDDRYVEMEIEGLKRRVESGPEVRAAG